MKNIILVYSGSGLWVGLEEEIMKLGDVARLEVDRFMAHGPGEAIVPRRFLATVPGSLMSSLALPLPMV